LAVRWRVERDHFDQRCAELRGHDESAFGGSIDQRWQLGFGFMDVGGTHGIKSNNPNGVQLAKLNLTEYCKDFVRLWTGRDCSEFRASPLRSRHAGRYPRFGCCRQGLEQTEWNFGQYWRTGWDSNPRTPFRVLLTFQASAFDHSATCP
jgi:hypothetical protein